METLAPASELVENAKAHTQRNAKQLLHTLSFVPDDKLTWSPAPGAKSALGIAAHCALVNPAFAMGIRNEMPAELPAPEQMMAMMAEREQAVKSRDEAIRLIESSVQDVLNSLTPADDVLDVPAREPHDGPLLPDRLLTNNLGRPRAALRDVVPVGFSRG